MSEPQYVKIAAPVKWLSLFIVRFYVGQNVYQTSTKGVAPNGQRDWNVAVQAWYNEVKDFNRNNVSPYQ
jgi:hypothetical protein